MKKVCKNCNIEKELENFTKRSENSYRGDCKECISLKRKVRYEETKNIERDYIIVDNKVCIICKEEKDISNFIFRKDSKDGHRNECEKCRYSRSKNSENYLENSRKYSKKYKEENKDKILESSKLYYENNKEKVKENQKVYYDNNKYKKMDRRKEYRNENRERLNEETKIKKRNNSLLRLKSNIRTLIGNGLKKMGYSKSSHTYEILGCSYDEFKVHIESHFTSEMTWENRELWHIDHIIPLSFAETEEECLKLNHYLNLRPLWAFDNLSKGDSIEEVNDIYEEILSKR